MTVWAGTPLEAVQTAARNAGHYFALDLGARGSCAIGGNLSTNAGGNRVIRYGMARELVLGLEVVLPDGTIVTSLNKMIKNNAGYDLKHLFIGSEGTLGIITRIVLRLHPQPQCTMAALCALPDYAAVVKLLGAARSGLGPLLSAFEVMWPDYWHVVTRRVGVRAPVGDGNGVYVLIEAQGTDQTVDGPQFQAWLEGLLCPSQWLIRNLSGRSETPAQNSFQRSAPIFHMTWACRSPTWTHMPGNARLHCRKPFPAARAFTTATSATAICT
jgi:FAD/FMN-containing dehydrogenase